MESSLQPAPSQEISVRQDRGRLSAQAAQLLVHEQENIIPVLLQQGAVEGTAALQGAGQESHDHSHQGNHLLSLIIRCKRAWRITAALWRKETHK
jgi:hypothetical protein